MKKENQIEEMASDIEQSGMLDSLSRCRIVAEELYTKGYKKHIDGVWVRVEERLPDKNDVFIVALEDGKYKIIFLDVRSYADGRWLNIPDKLKVTHWMNLPKPPKGE